MDDKEIEALRAKLAEVMESLREAREGWGSAIERENKLLHELTQLQAIRDKASDGKVQCEDCGSILARWV